MKKGQKQYGQEFHERVRQLRAEGKTRAEIALEMGVGLQVIYKMYERQNKLDREAGRGIFRSKHNSGRKSNRELTETEVLNARIEQLEMENEVLKKLDEALRGCKK
jgi:transposase-like protein